MTNLYRNQLLPILLLLLVAVSNGCKSPDISKEEKGEKKVSAAMKRYQENYNSVPETENEFYTKFLYSDAKGLGKENGVTRRDPSTILKVGDTYYIWYTRSEGDVPPKKGNLAEASKECYHKANPRIRRWTWDYACIYYATSKDGFNWDEQGVAVTPGPEGEFDCRSVFTPDVMCVNNKYYLYYQADKNAEEKPTVIGMSWADSPDGPWYRHDKPVLAPSDPNSFCHDPKLIVREGKYWMYYKGSSVPLGKGIPQPSWGVAIADSPEGPFINSEWNPITNSGHEVLVWPYKSGVAALLCRNGYEKNSVQFAEDGVNFEVMATVRFPPTAPGAYNPDAFTNTTNGDGITWGLCHIRQSPGHAEAYLQRFDCDLSQSAVRPKFKLWWADDPAGMYNAPGNRLDFE